MPALIASVAVLIAACGGSAETDLEPYELLGPQLVIDRPVDWLAVTENRTTLFAQSQDALDAAYAVPPPPATALTIVFDHRHIDYMRSIGYVAEPPTNQDLFEFNSEEFGWELIGETETIEVLGSEALRARVITQVGVSEVIQGALPDSPDIFLFELSGPDPQALDSFLSTWETIVASVAPMD